MKHVLFKLKEKYAKKIGLCLIITRSVNMYMRTDRQINEMNEKIDGEVDQENISFKSTK